jgi:hypothetical protein
MVKIVSSGLASIALLAFSEGSAQAAPADTSTTTAAESLASQAIPPGLTPSFCVFGKHKHGSGCHGGTIAHAGGDVLEGTTKCLNGVFGPGTAVAAGAGTAIGGAAGSVVPGAGTAAGAGAGAVIGTGYGIGAGCAQGISADPPNGDSSSGDN